MKRIAIVLALAAAFFHTATFAGEFVPAGRVTMLITTKPGANHDIYSRTIGEAIKRGNPPFTLLMINKDDGGGTVGMRDVSALRAGAEADNTLLPFPIGDVSYLLTNTRLRMDDFTPLAVLVEDKHFFYTAANSRFKTFQDVVDALEKEPLVLAGGRGDDIMFFEAVKRAVDKKDNLTYLQTDGANAAAVQVLGGHVEIGIGKMAVLDAFFKNGDFHPLAVEGDARQGEPYRDVPTFKELGYPGIAFSQLRGFFASKNMSPEARDYWSALLVEAATSDYFVENYVKKFSSELKPMNAEETRKIFHKAQEDALAAGYGR